MPPSNHKINPPSRFLDALHLSMAFVSVWIYLIRNWGSDSIHDYIPW